MEAPVNQLTVVKVSRNRYKRIPLKFEDNGHIHGSRGIPSSRRICEACINYQVEIVVPAELLSQAKS